MNRLLALALALVVALPAAAQIDPDTAFPLAVGNRWEFIDRTTNGVMTWDIVSDTTVGGERVARLQVNGGPVCGVRVTVEAAPVPSVGYSLVDPDDPGQPCPETELDFPLYFPTAFYPSWGTTIYGSPTAQTLTIGDTTLTRNGWGYFGDDGVIGLHHEESGLLAEGFGPVRFRRTFGGTGNPQSPLFDYDLEYARIGGVAYGQPLGVGSVLTPYLPLGVGDRWDYALAEGPAGAETPNGVVSMTVTEVVSDAGGRRDVRLSVVQRSRTGVEMRQACGMSRNAFPNEFLGAWGCFYGDVTFPASFVLRTEQGPGPVDIGGQVAVFDRAAGTSVVSQILPNFSVRMVRSVDAARGVGIVRWSTAQTFSTPTITPRYYSGRLVYARVDGVERGVQAVADEAGAAPAAALRLTAGPNPARGATTLRYALPAGVRGEIAVADALGREVRRLGAEAGTTEAALDVRGLAPGVYVVRLVAAGASASARLVVAR